MTAAQSLNELGHRCGAAQEVQAAHCAHGLKEQRHSPVQAAFGDTQIDAAKAQLH